MLLKILFVKYSRNFCLLNAPKLLFVKCSENFRFVNASKTFVCSMLQNPFCQVVPEYSQKKLFEVVSTIADGKSSGLAAEYQVWVTVRTIRNVKGHIYGTMPGAFTILVKICRKFPRTPNFRWYFTLLKSIGGTFLML